MTPICRYCTRPAVGTLDCTSPGALADPVLVPVCRQHSISAYPFTLNAGITLDGCRLCGGAVAGTLRSRKRPDLPGSPVCLRHGDRTKSPAVMFVADSPA